ncbi:uncharacterized protein [Euphorbia lathyris]|uniref:uncharacterized protein n=1 Tax=Euphorbia lathyris TaxID=212925 RepID=UPI0033135760
MKFQKQGRKLTILHKKLIVDNSKMNVGPVRTYRQIKENVGGYNNVGASKQDFKNFHRDLKAYIYESDAQMFIDIFSKKILLWSAFFPTLIWMKTIISAELYGQTPFVERIMLYLVIWYLLTQHTKQTDIT